MDLQRFRVMVLSKRYPNGLRTGSRGRDEFARNLRAAIDASGLGLERLSHRLRERGPGLSVATLSYSQSGRSIPTRRSSLAALTYI